MPCRSRQALRSESSRRLAARIAKVKSLLYDAREKREHPLNRIMAIEREGDALVVKTTDIHLPRRIGDDRPVAISHQEPPGR